MDLWRRLELASVALLLASCVGPAPRLVLQVTPSSLPADGYATARIVVHGEAPGAKVEIVAGKRRGRVEGDSFRAGVLPGTVLLRASAPGYSDGTARVDLAADVSDSARDGMPDYLRLEDDADRAAFRDWFTFLAEAQYFRKGGPYPDITDCAALIRFAYREALRAHDGEWAAGLRLPLVPALPAVRKYEYPYTPAGAALFRVSDGTYRSAAELGEFADARSLQRWNTRFVSRDLERARRGDILFYRQEQQSLPFHAMVFVGPSHFDRAAGPWVVYHTGPAGEDPGEVRRVTAGELRAHPEARWRPIPSNAGFLGVYRWNILRELP